MQTKTALGIWPTLGWTLLAMMVFGMGQTLGFALAKNAELERLFPEGDYVEIDGEVASNGEPLATPLMQNGNVVPWAGLAAQLPACLFLLMVIGANRNFMIREYYRFKGFSFNKFFPWLAATVGFILMVTWLERFELFQDDSITNQLNTATSLWPLFIGACIGAPIFEEILCRGFLFSAFAAKVGGPLASVITATIFAVMHMQYSWALVLLIIPIGTILGLARWKCDSIWASIILHAIVNTTALFWGIWS